MDAIACLWKSSVSERGIGRASETKVDHVGGRRAMTKEEADLIVCMIAGDEAGISVIEE